MISALLLSVIAASSPAPGASDGWLAWQGCWRALGDEDPSSVLCIIPDGEGARLVNVARGAIRGEMRLVSDGSAQPFALEGCKGTQQAAWSKDQQRLFVNSTMTCGEAIQRNVSGIMAMQSRSEWMNVESVTTGTNISTRVIRYVAVESSEIPESIAAPLRANRLARETARYSAIAKVHLDDVREATEHSSEAAVTTWLTEVNEPFDLDGKKLVALADAGVSPTVIDVVVAVSNPDHFDMETRPDDDDDYDRRRRARVTDGCYDPFYDPWLGPMSYGYGYNRCGRYGGHFGPYGNDWDYGYGRPPIIVVRNPSNPLAKLTRKGYKKGGDDTASPSPNPSTTTTSSDSKDSKDSKDSSSSGKTTTTRTAKPREDK